jgi:hypothetical protein
VARDDRDTDAVVSGDEVVRDRDSVGVDREQAGAGREAGEQIAGIGGGVGSVVVREPVVGDRDVAGVRDREAGCALDDQAERVSGRQVARRGDSGAVLDVEADRVLIGDVRRDGDVARLADVDPCVVGAARPVARDQPVAREHGKGAVVVVVDEAVPDDREAVDVTQ